MEMDMTKTMDHLKNHVKYSATAEDLKHACSDMSDFTSEEKTWFNDHLPAKTYHSAEEVKTALGW